MPRKTGAMGTRSSARLTATAVNNGGVRKTTRAAGAGNAPPSGLKEESDGTDASATTRVSRLPISSKAKGLPSNKVAAIKASAKAEAEDEVISPSSRPSRSAGRAAAKRLKEPQTAPEPASDSEDFVPEPEEKKARRTAKTTAKKKKPATPVPAGIEPSLACVDIWLHALVLQGNVRRHGHAEQWIPQLCTKL
eukprot:scaffold13465_cov36-Prasinocladus_malaysianus.AAC.1